MATLHLKENFACYSVKLDVVASATPTEDGRELSCCVRPLVRIAKQARSSLCKLKLVNLVLRLSRSVGID